MFTCLIAFQILPVLVVIDLVQALQDQSCCVMLSNQFMAYCLLHIACYLLSIVKCLMHVAYCLLPTHKFHISYRHAVPDRIPLAPDPSNWPASLPTGPGPGPWPRPGSRAQSRALYIYTCMLTKGLCINYITLAIDPFLGPYYCLSIAYWLALMHICSAITDRGPGPGPKAQGAYRVY